MSTFSAHAGFAPRESDAPIAEDLGTEMTAAPMAEAPAGKPIVAVLMPRHICDTAYLKYVAPCPAWSVATCRAMRITSGSFSRARLAENQATSESRRSAPSITAHYTTRAMKMSGSKPKQSMPRQKPRDFGLRHTSSQISCAGYRNRVMHIKTKESQNELSRI